MQTEKEIVEETDEEHLMRLFKQTKEEAFQKGKELGKQEGRKEFAEEIIEYIKRERYSNEETPFKNGFNIALDNLQNEKLQKEVEE